MSHYKNLRIHGQRLLGYLPANNICWASKSNQHPSCCWALSFCSILCQKGIAHKWYRTSGCSRWFQRCRASVGTHKLAWNEEEQLYRTQWFLYRWKLASWIRLQLWSCLAFWHRSKWYPESVAHILYSLAFGNMFRWQQSLRLLRASICYRIVRWSLLSSWGSEDAIGQHWAWSSTLYMISAIGEWSWARSRTMANCCSSQRISQLVLMLQSSSRESSGWWWSPTFSVSLHLSSWWIHIAENRVDCQSVISRPSSPFR